MRTRQIIFCAVILFVAPAMVIGQKTEVRVEKGKIVAESANE